MCAKSIKSTNDIGDRTWFWISCSGPFGFIGSKHFWIIWLSNRSIMSVPDEDYFRNATCALHLISPFIDFKVNIIFNW